MTLKIKSKSSPNGVDSTQYKKRPILNPQNCYTLAPSAQINGHNMSIYREMIICTLQVVKIPFLLHLKCWIIQSLQLWKVTVTALLCLFFFFHKTCPWLLPSLKNTHSSFNNFVEFITVFFGKISLKQNYVKYNIYTYKMLLANAYNCKSMLLGEIYAPLIKKKN